MLHEELLGVQILELRIGLRVAQEPQHHFAALHGPAPLGRLELLRLRRAADGAPVLAKDNAPLNGARRL